MQIKFERKFLFFVRLFITLIIASLLFYFAYEQFTTPVWFRQFDELTQHPKANVIGIKSTSISFFDKMEIHDVIKKALRAQWTYYYDKDKNKLDRSIKNLYLSGEYQCSRIGMEDTKQYSVPNPISSEYISQRFKDIENLRFTKPRGYDNFDNIVGIASGYPSQIGTQFFILEKIEDKWKIKNEDKIYFEDIGALSNVGNSIIQQLIEQKENKTPQAEIAQYFDAITKSDELKALESWQLLKEEDWSLNPENYYLLKERRNNITEELIKKKISHFQIENIKWRNTDFDIGYFISGADINNDCRSELADSAQVKVQLTDFDNNKPEYIIDVFVQEIGSKTNKRDYSLLRNWEIRDIYPQGQEPLFETILK